MSLSSRFASIATNVSKSSSKSKREGAKSRQSPSNGKAQKVQASKLASKNKRADQMKARRMGTKPKSLKEAAKGKNTVAAKKKATISIGKGSSKKGKEAGEVKDKKKKKKAANKKKKATKKPAEPKKSSDDLNMEMDSYFASKKAATEETPAADASAS